MLHPKHACPVFVSDPRYLEQMSQPGIFDAGLLLIANQIKNGACTIPHFRDASTNQAAQKTPQQRTCPHVWGSFASAMPSWQQDFFLFFFLPGFNNPYGLQIGAETLPSCSWHIYWHKVHVSVCQLPEGQDLSLINWPGQRVGRCRFSHLWYGEQEKHFWCDLQSLSSLS